MNTYVFICIHMYSYIFICIHVYSYVFIRIHMHSYVFLCIHMYSYVFICIHMHYESSCDESQNLGFFDRNFLPFLALPAKIARERAESSLSRQLVATISRGLKL